MVASLVTNQYKFPKGYRQLPAVVSYKPNNGFLPSASPARSDFGASQEFTIAAVPADLAQVTLFPPSGQFGQISFQFVYNGSVWANGVKIPLPASGGSTAAQVTTAWLAVLQQASGLTFQGVNVPFQWVAQQTGSNKITVSYITAGPITSTSVPANITQVSSPGGFSLGVVVPSKFGQVSSFAPGT